MYNRFSRDLDLDNLGISRVAVVHPEPSEIPSFAQGYSANNVYPGFPPLMADGRSLIACWQPEAVENNQLVKNSGIKTNWEYRKYLTKNADSIMHRNFQEAANDMGYYTRGEYVPQSSNFTPMFSPYNLNTSSPAMYNSATQAEIPFAGIALAESDIKKDYMARTHTMKMESPILSERDFMRMVGGK